MQRLKEELKIAINKEEYEKAAKIRDEIRKLESQLEGER
ncbi:MAG: UvrB/UvrC motif-containing protein, partial [Spirochaetota bacterium]